MAGSTGTANVSGAGSLWIVGGGFFIGGTGNGTLNIDTGGHVVSQQSFIGNDVGSVGLASVTGSGSSWDTDVLAVAYGDNSNGKLKISSAGHVNSSMGIVGAGAGSVGIVEIDGVGSQWAVANDLTVGYLGDGTIKITNAGQLGSGLSTIGANAGVGSVIVDGAGSIWNATSVSVAGSNNSTGHLTISNGGAVYSIIADMAFQAGSVATADVTGSGSLWAAGSFIVGGAGDATLNVSNGAQLNNFSALVGGGTGSGKLLVTDAGSSWLVSTNLDIGNGQVTIANGATMSTGGPTTIGLGAGSNGSVLITGAGSTWTTTADIFVGGTTLNPGAGTLTITNGGAVDVNGGAGTVFVGTGNGLGSRLVVDGALNGQVVVNTDGRLGGIGTIGNITVLGTIAPGNSIGTLNVAGNLTMQAGSIYEVEANAAGQADKIIATGTATVNGGTVKVLAGQGLMRHRPLTPSSMRPVASTAPLIKSRRTSPS